MLMKRRSIFGHWLGCWGHVDNACVGGIDGCVGGLCEAFGLNGGAFPLPRPAGFFKSGLVSTSSTSSACTINKGHVKSKSGS